MPVRNLVWVLIFFTVALLLYNSDTVAKRQTVYELFSPLVDVRSEIQKRYVEEVEDESLMRGAIQGMLQSLDPYSTYLSEEDYPLFKQQTAGEFGGIGIEAGMKNGVLTVISPLEDTPAFKAGLLADDQILEIDGEPTDRMTMSDAVSKLMGRPGTRVTLKVLHTLTGQTETVTITRAIINVSSVMGWQRNGNGSWSYWIDPDERLAYIRITGFLDNTPKAFDTVIDSLAEKDLRGLLLDLRFNPGGSLPAAAAVADRFLESGPIVSVRGRWRAEETLNASPENALTGFPIVVLVNNYTASGAEIVAGALRDHGRAVVLGERTYGKGSVQEVIPLGDGDRAIKLTTAYYYLPKGELIHRTAAANRAGKWGVEPNITVTLADDEIRQLLEARQAVDRLNGVSTQPAASRPAPAKPLVDRQVVAALEALKGKLAGGQDDAAAGAATQSAEEEPAGAGASI